MDTDLFHALLFLLCVGLTLGLGWLVAGLYDDVVAAWRGTRWPSDDCP